MYLVSPYMEVIPSIRFSQVERQELERDRKKKKKFEITEDGAEKEEALPELVPPASSTVCSNIMENITGFKVSSTRSSLLTSIRA